MDAGTIAGVVSAIGGAAAAVVGAAALLVRYSAPNSKAVQTLRSLWDWLVLHDHTDAVPDRIEAAVLKIIDADDDDEKDRK